MPPLPTAGVAQIQPDGAASETKVVPEGSGSTSSADFRSPLVLLLAVIVYVRSAPARTGSGAPVLAMEKIVICAAREEAPMTTARAKKRTPEAFRGMEKSPAEGAKTPPSTR